jgi:hypothetical protein
MKTFFFALTFALGLLAVGATDAQSPVVIQAVTPAPAVAAPTPVAASAAPDSRETLQLLQQMQAANLTTLKKQEAALQTLDTLEKAAEDIKIFSKRG